MKNKHSFFGFKLTEAMQSRGINQTMLAKLLNTTQQTVSRWCNGICEPDYDTLILLCGLLDETPNSLLNYEEKAAKKYAETVLDNFVGNDKKFQKEQTIKLDAMMKDGATGTEMNKAIEELFNKRKKELKQQLGLI